MVSHYLQDKAGNEQQLNPESQQRISRLGRCDAARVKKAEQPGHFGGSWT
jgi:hypothetical protein